RSRLRYRSSQSCASMRSVFLFNVSGCGGAAAPPTPRWASFAIVADVRGLRQNSCRNGKPARPPRRTGIEPGASAVETAGGDLDRPVSLATELARPPSPEVASFAEAGDFMQIACRWS